MKTIIKNALGMLILFTILCGVLYTGTMTVVGQVLFFHKANGSIMEVDGIRYGSELIGQYFDDDHHMWGRIMNLDFETFKDKEGKLMMYAAPSNQATASQEYQALIKERIDNILSSTPSLQTEKIPVDLVTVSGSGLDPHISYAAAKYQIPRLEKTTGRGKKELMQIIDACTQDQLFGIFGEKVVNVLKVNLMLDGIL